MSTRKSQKAELVAIYRLEFYKKQSNWKLSSSKKPKNPEKTVKEILNTTYKIEEKSHEKDLSDPLNVAFVDSDSDKKLKLIKSPNSPELSQEWQEPVNIWPQVETHNNTIDNIKPVLHCTKQRLKNLQRASDLANLQNNYIENENTDCPQNVQNWDEWPQNINLLNNGMSPQNIDLKTNIACSSSNTFSNFTIHPENIDSCTNFAECSQNIGEGLGWNGFGEIEGNWPFETAIWVGAGHMAQDIYQAENLDVIDGNTPDIYAGEWPLVAPPYELPWLLDMEGDMSVDSAGEFMRGADAVPHSSEIDLSLPNCVKACDVSFNSLSRLSSEQLVLAARLHSRVLRRLLLESQMRQKLRSTQSLSTTDFSYEEFPTRDVGPTDQSSEKLFSKDVIIAGSHKNVVGVGRGRGRLPNRIDLKHFSR